MQFEEEGCDDGNDISGDGCSEDCQVEEGWVCSGLNCETVCGDKIIAGQEDCDDGNQISNDGCSSSCLIESNILNV